MRLMKFWEWMNQKYIDWRGDSRKTISEFAQYVGVAQSVMSKCMTPGLQGDLSGKPVLQFANRSRTLAHQGHFLRLCKINALKSFLWPPAGNVMYSRLATTTP